MQRPDLTPKALSFSSKPFHFTKRGYKFARLRSFAAALAPFSQPLTKHVSSTLGTNLQHGDYLSHSLGYA